MFCLRPAFRNHKDPKAFRVSDIRQAPHWGFLVIRNVILKESDKQFLTLHMFKDLCQEEGENTLGTRR